MDVVIFVLLFIFFKQKTAYEMRISDWSSDVCSSDLTHGDVQFLLPRIIPPGESMPSSDLGEVGTCRPAGKGWQGGSVVCEGQIRDPSQKLGTVQSTPYATNRR